ncbi:sensor histidine kinase [Sporanaerobacter acetigenes]|uniref:sensor histidine kinase n=1 Tax=Sporanaerobacter acetigenes TaxID=165813 RepID=UPI001047972E|nr:histidine kinase [Sporanaerobacter acetigenes]
MEIKNRNYKEKIKYFFLRYAFIPILILYILFLIFIIFTTKIRAVNDATRSGDLIGGIVLEVYDNYYNEIEKMAKSNTVIDFVDTHLNSNLVYEEFYKFNNSQKVKSTFHIVDSEGLFLAYTTPSDPDINDIILKDIIPSINKNPKEVLTEANKIKFPHDRYTVYTFGKAIYKDEEIIGYIVYQLYEEDIQKLIFVQDAEVVVVTDQYDRIIATTNNIVKGLLNKFTPEYTDAMRYVKIRSGKYHMVKKTLPGGNINIYTLNSIKYDRATFIYYGIFAGIVSLLLYILINYLAERMSSENTKSIDKLLIAVKDLQNGNMDSYVNLDTGDELEILANQYNIMLDRLNELMKKNQELSDIRRINEIKQLQAQFNPHFIFNVLETLRYTIIIDPVQAQEIIMSLSRILRYSIKNEEQNVLFKEDLAYIEDYLRLHKIRFKERLNYSINISNEVKNSYVPKLLLQPIIENSIKYGYGEKDFLNIDIVGERIEKNVVFQVKDNGSGISEAELIIIKKILDSQENLSKHSGLYNIHRRLILLYGNDYGIEIDNVYGEGIIVTVKIPYLPYGREKDDV